MSTKSHGFLGGLERLPSLAGSFWPSSDLCVSIPHLPISCCSVCYEFVFSFQLSCAIALVLWLSLYWSAVVCLQVCTHLFAERVAVLCCFSRPICFWCVGLLLITLCMHAEIFIILWIKMDQHGTHHAMHFSLIMSKPWEVSGPTQWNFFGLPCVGTGAFAIYTHWHGSITLIQSIAFLIILCLILFRWTASAYAVEMGERGWMWRSTGWCLCWQLRRCGPPTASRVGRGRWPWSNLELFAWRQRHIRCIIKSKSFSHSLYLYVLCNVWESWTICFDLYFHKMLPTIELQP